jgi:hypothetical protein
VGFWGATKNFSAEKLSWQREGSELRTAQEWVSPEASKVITGIGRSRMTALERPSATAIQFFHIRPLSWHLVLRLIYPSIHDHRRPLTFSTRGLRANRRRSRPHSLSFHTVLPDSIYSFRPLNHDDLLDSQ